MSGFTLIEILVSIAVLTLLIVAVTQIVSSTRNLTADSRHRMEADSQAREVFDRIASDVAGMMLRPDVDYLFTKSTGNDAMFFYSEAPAYFAGAPGAELRSPVSLVGYRMVPTLQLERLGKGLTWAGTPGAEQGGAAVFLTFPFVSPSPSPTPSPTPTPFPQTTLAGNWGGVLGAAGGTNADGTSDDYHVLSNTVFRFEYCFLLKTGYLSNHPYGAASTAPQGMKEVSAIIVAIAILDSTSRQLAPDTSRMITALKDFSAGDNLPASSTDLMAKSWQTTIDAPDFPTTIGLPKSTAAGVRVYQRYFYLNTK